VYFKSQELKNNNNKFISFWTKKIPIRKRKYYPLFIYFAVGNTVSFPKRMFALLLFSPMINAALASILKKLLLEIDNKFATNFLTVLYVKAKFRMKNTKEYTPLRQIVFYQIYSLVRSQVRLEELY
jgi:galactose-1-phosphate uridylyltransferase